jgi:hypothetical protein
MHQRDEVVVFDPDPGRAFPPGNFRFGEPGPFPLSVAYPTPNSTEIAQLSYYFLAGICEDRIVELPLSQHSKLIFR